MSAIFESNFDKLLLIAAANCSQNDIEEFDSINTDNVVFDGRFHRKKYKIIRDYNRPKTFKIKRRLIIGIIISLAIMISLGIMAVIAKDAWNDSGFGVDVEEYSDHFLIGFIPSQGNMYSSIEEETIITEDSLPCDSNDEDSNGVVLDTTEISSDYTTEEEITEETTKDGEFDSATYMRYTLNSDGKSYSVCPEGMPETTKELVFPGEYKGLPVTKIKGNFKGEYSIETIVISEGIEEILIGFDYCRDIKNIYIPSSVIHIQEGAFNCRATMGGHGFIKSNVIEKIVVAEGNPYYYVEGNCLIERISKKVILGCNSSVIPSDGSVKSIGYAAFANCHSMETIVIPESIIEIEDSAFDNCDSLKQVYITSSVLEDKKVVSFDEEFAFGYNSERIFYVPDAESLEVYSKLFRPHINIQIGNP